MTGVNLMEFVFDKYSRGEPMPQGVQVSIECDRAQFSFDDKVDEAVLKALKLLATDEHPAIALALQNCGPHGPFVFNKYRLKDDNDPKVSVQLIQNGSIEVMKAHTQKDALRIAGRLFKAKTTLVLDHFESLRATEPAEVDAGALSQLLHPTPTWMAMPFGAERAGEPFADVHSERIAEIITTSANDLQKLCHAAASNAGWWGSVLRNQPDPRENPMCFSQKLMLVVSELAEAMEGDRKGLMDDHLPHLPMREVELADALIRIFDMAGAFGMNIGRAMAEKMAYNAQRADHKPAAREAEGGKKY